MLPVKPSTLAYVTKAKQEIDGGDGEGLRFHCDDKDCWDNEEDTKYIFSQSYAQDISGVEFFGKNWYWSAWVLRPERPKGAKDEVKRL